MTTTDNREERLREALRMMADTGPDEFAEQVWFAGQAARLGPNWRALFEVVAAVSKAMRDPAFAPKVEALLCEALNHEATTRLGDFRFTSNEEPSDDFQLVARALAFLQSYGGFAKMLEATERLRVQLREIKSRLDGIAKLAKWRKRRKDGQEVLCYGEEDLAEAGELLPEVRRLTENLGRLRRACITEYENWWWAMVWYQKDVIGQAKTRYLHDSKLFQERGSEESAPADE